MILPDCRRDESYNQDFLNERDKEFLAGFDWATEMACDNFFDNRYDDTNSDENSDYLDRTLTKSEKSKHMLTMCALKSSNGLKNSETN